MQDMQDMIERLNHSGRRLSKGHRKIAQYIVEHYDKAVFMTASRLGESVGVSESTVVRFASVLGYEGYPQLQRALQELVSHRLTAVQRFEMSSEIDPNAVLRTVLSEGVLARLRPQSFIVDLASRPGGTDFDAARRLGHRAIHALSLPAACAPETAGEAVAQTVCDMIGQREEAS